MPDAQELLHSNLHEVFSERNPQRRRAAIERTYAEDVTFIDPEGEFVGRQSLNDQAQKLLDSVMAGFELEEDGPRYLGPDIAVLAWRFGPPGTPIARGVDVLTIRDGRVSVVRDQTRLLSSVAPDQGHGVDVPVPRIMAIPAPVDSASAGLISNGPCRRR